MVRWGVDVSGGGREDVAAATAAPTAEFAVGVEAVAREEAGVGDDDEGGDDYDDHGD